MNEWMNENKSHKNLAIACGWRSLFNNWFFGMHTNVILLFIKENDAIKQMEASIAELNLKMRIQGHASGLCIWIFFRHLLLETT